MPSTKRRKHAFALAGLALVCAGFAAGATWGAARTRVAIEAEHLDEVTQRDPVLILTASCTLLTAVQDLAAEPGERHVDELDGAVDRVLEAQSRLAPIDFERGGVNRRLRSSWWFHSFDAVADRIAEYREALEKLSSSVGKAQHISSVFDAYGKLDLAALPGVTGDLRDAIERTAWLIHDDPQNWPCWRRAAGL
jgi:hypothetical protein